jgi:iron donor protein CyaY
MLDEKAYRLLVDDTLRTIDEAFADVDPDLVESSISQGALTLLINGKLRAIVSPQPPVQQMWLAFRDRAWHFDLDQRDRRWRDDKNAGEELFALLARIVREAAGVDVSIAYRGSTIG